MWLLKKQILIGFALVVLRIALCDPLWLSDLCLTTKSL